MAGERPIAGAGRALAEAGFARLREELQAAFDTADACPDLTASTRAGRPDASAELFAARLHATARAYVRFATRDAALLELMFATKHQADSVALEAAADRAFSVILELIRHGQAVGVLDAGEPERVGLLLFATMHGIAALFNSGMLPAEPLDQLVSDAVTRFLRGSRSQRTGEA